MIGAAGDAHVRLYERRPMDPQRNPVFRRAIIPWYDAKVSCLITVFAMGFVFCFGSVGISVIAENADYTKHLWIVLLILLLSMAVIVSIAIRLTRRHIDQKKTP